MTRIKVAWSRFKKTARSLGRAALQFVYLLGFVVILTVLLVLALVAVFVGPVAFLAWMLARFLYWILTSTVIAFDPNNWSRLHRWPPKLSRTICLFIGVETWLLLYFHIGKIGSAYTAFMLKLVWPFAGWVTPITGKLLGWPDCGAADGADDPCKLTILKWIEGSGQLSIEIVIVTIWALAICGLLARVAGESRRVCLIERAP